MHSGVSSHFIPLTGLKRLLTNNTAIFYYFTNEKSDLKVDYTSKAFAQGMAKLIQSIDLADRIGNEGYKVGIHCFEYHTESNKIADFMRQM